MRYEVQLDALQMDLKMHSNNLTECELICVTTFQICSSIGCSTDRLVGALELNIQLDTEADGPAKEPRWHVSLDAPQTDMWMHMATVVVTLDAKQMDMMMHSDSVEIVVTRTVLMLKLLFMIVSGKF